MRKIRQKYTSYVIFLITCGILAPSVMTPAVADHIIKLSQAADILAADTPISLSNSSRFLAPKGWTKSVRGESVIIGAPELRQI